MISNIYCSQHISLPFSLSMTSKYCIFQPSHAYLRYSRLTTCTHILVSASDLFSDLPVNHPVTSRLLTLETRPRAQSLAAHSQITGQLLRGNRFMSCTMLDMRFHAIVSSASNLSICRPVKGLLSHAWLISVTTAAPRQIDGGYVHWFQGATSQALLTRNVSISV